jgi:DNA gyrase subunit A
VHIEQMSRNRSRIVVTDLPYQVNKTRLLERIAVLVRDGKIEGITDLRDESDRQGMRVCIELTRTVEPREVLSQLFRLTPMQATFGMRMLALAEGEPRLLPLKRVLIHYLEHRQEIIRRRSQYLLQRAKERAHILEGLLKALDEIDEVISIIRRSRTTDSARNNLRKRLGLTEVQAQAILDMPLKRLVALERRKIADEYKEKLREIKYLEGLLRSPTKIRKVIRDDLEQLKSKYGDARRTRIVDQEKGHHTARDLVEAEDVLVTLWRDGQVSRTARAPRVSSKAIPVAQVWGSTRDDVAFFSASGQAVMMPLHQVPADQNTPVSTLTELDRSETLVSALVLPHPPEGEEQPETYLTLVTRGGRIKRITLDDFSAANRGAVSAMNVEEDDQLSWVVQTHGQSELLLATRQGKAIRFSESEVRPMGLSAAGVLAVKFGRDDAVVGVGVARDSDFAILVTENGYAKRTLLKSFPTQKRYGGGVQAAKLTTGSGRVTAMTVASERQDVVLTTAKGRVTKLPVKAVRAVGRAAGGYRTRADNREPYVDLSKHGQPVLLTALASTKAAAKRARAKSSSRGQKPAGKKPPAKKSRGKTTRSTRTAPSRGKAAKTPTGKASTSRSRSTRSKTAGTKGGGGSATQMSLPLASNSKRAERKNTSRKRE